MPDAEEGPDFWQAQHLLEQEEWLLDRSAQIEYQKWLDNQKEQQNVVD